MTRFYIVRHARSMANSTGVLAGTTDSQLHPEGEKEAKLRAKELKDIAFAAAFSSDLIRAKRTAEIITLERKLAVVTTKLLRERHFGYLEGKAIVKSRSSLKDLLQAYRKIILTKKFNNKEIPDYETDEIIISRVFTFLRETALAYPDKNILVVSHAGIIDRILIHLGFAAEHELIGIKNTGYVVLDSDGIEFFIKETNGIKILH